MGGTVDKGRVAMMDVDELELIFLFPDGKSDVTWKGNHSAHGEGATGVSVCGLFRRLFGTLQL